MATWAVIAVVVLVGLSLPCRLSRRVRSFLEPYALYHWVAAKWHAKVTKNYAKAMYHYYKPACRYLHNGESIILREFSKCQMTGKVFEEPFNLKW